MERPSEAELAAERARAQRLAAAFAEHREKTRQLIEASREKIEASRKLLAKF